MAYIKKLRGRGVSGVVTAYGEVLFFPGADVDRWTNRLTRRIAAETRKAAPTNKRPRWAHYGKPLKGTIQASPRPRFQKTKNGARVYSAVGSTARHAYYVDQGTGIYGGNGPYQAKILPPWTRGSPSLFEHTWRPSPGSPPVGTVTVRGQKGQGFFEEGLNRGFERMHNRSVQLPGEGVSISRALAAFPRGLEFAGNTEWSFAFDTQLREWRLWRDEAWRGGDSLGTRPGTEPRNRRRAAIYRELATTPKTNRRPPDPKNLAAYKASKEATERRKKDLLKSLAKETLVKKERAERERQKQADARKTQARSKAASFGKKLAKAGATDIKGSWVTAPGGQITGYRVSWTTPRSRQKKPVRRTIVFPA